MSATCARLLQEIGWQAGLTRRVCEELTRVPGRFPDIESIAIGDLELDPNNPDVIYAGTGGPRANWLPFGNQANDGILALDEVANDGGERVEVTEGADYVRPALGERLVARARAESTGQAQSVARCEVYAVADGVEKLCALAQGTIVRLGEGKA